MASSTTESTTKVILTDSSKWESWNEVFITKAKQFLIWQYINADGMLTSWSKPLTDVDTFVEQPEKPQFADFEIKATVVTRLASLQSTATVEGESNDRDGNMPTLTATLLSIPEPNITYGDLNDKGQKAFQFAWTMYQDELKEYRLHTDNVWKLKEWVFESVVNSYKESCCKSDQSIKDWYRNLKEAVGSTTRMQRDIAIAQY